jgi:hypothetical protein
VIAAIPRRRIAGLPPTSRPAARAWSESRDAVGEFGAVGVQVLGGRVERG